MELTERGSASIYVLGRMSSRDRLRIFLPLRAYITTTFLPNPMLPQLSKVAIAPWSETDAEAGLISLVSGRFHTILHVCPDMCSRNPRALRSGSRGGAPGFGRPLTLSV